MGTRMAPSYANLFMGTLETELVKQNSKNIQIWKRFIDDIFIIWTGTLEEFQDFMDKINQIHPTIKFTHEVSKNELTFLDVTVYKGDRFQTENKLDIKTHIKKTNKQLEEVIKHRPPGTIGRNIFRTTVRMQLATMQVGTPGHTKYLCAAWTPHVLSLPREESKTSAYEDS